MNYPLRALKSPEDYRDWKAATIYARTVKSVLPKTLDLRKQLQPIRDQGNQGTCAAQTAACMKEWQEKIDADLSEHLSPQFVYNLRVNQNSEGMYGRDVMKILSNHGICRERIFRYKTMHEPPENARKDAGNYKIKGYARVETVTDLKKALVKNGPCYISFPTYNFGSQFWKPQTPDEQQRGGHAVTVVGYDKKGFIIRNSWGTRWGERGYTNYAYSDFGAHWEIWTTIDDQSSEPVEPPTPKCKCVIM